jgi:hypothetical protein
LRGYTISAPDDIVFEREVKRWLAAYRKDHDLDIASTYF